MTRKKFTGEGVYWLSKGQMEPYRLWFEYLKLAHRDGTVDVDQQFYADWGDVQNADFDDWWKANWKHLFAAPPSTGRLSSLADCRAALEDNTSILVRVSLTETAAMRMKGFRQAVDEALADRRIEASAGARFTLTDSDNFRAQDVRILLRFYGSLLDNNGNIDAACRQVVGWRAGRRSIFLPGAFMNYVTLLDTIASGRWGGSKSQLQAIEGSKGSTYDSIRRAMKRYETNARKIAKNVAKGEFPGRY
jgi:hypothetical protein